MLLDTNIFLEILLDQEKSKECIDLLNDTQTKYISQFSLYSIGIILSKNHKENIFADFIEDIKESVTTLSTDYQDLTDVAANMKKIGLDFDDSIQYTLCKKHKLKIISFDKDFNKTDLVRSEPQEIMGKGLK